MGFSNFWIFNSSVVALQERRLKNGEIKLKNGAGVGGPLRYLLIPYAIMMKPLYFIPLN